MLRRLREKNSQIGFEQIFEEDTMRILFSDEKIFDIDGVYNSQNDRMWAPSRTVANELGGIRTERKFPQKVMEAILSNQ
jgi:hypothetical protein